jgi:hypothetical protein
VLYGYGGVNSLIGLSARELRGLVNPADDEEIAMRPDEELLGVVVHSGLVLARSQDVVAALRRITAFPAGLSLDAAVPARARQVDWCPHRQAPAGYRRAESPNVSRPHPPIGHSTSAEG